MGMKVLLWVSFLFLIPVCGWAQGRLFLRATISMPVSGSSDFQGYVNHNSGAFDGFLEVTLHDSIALVAGKNRDSLFNIGLALGSNQFICVGVFNAQFDSESHKLLKVSINGEAKGGKGFFVSLDSLEVVALSDSTWTVADQSVACNYTCYYADKYLLPNGSSGEDIASGIGQTIFVGRNILGVRPSSRPSTIHIISLGPGVIQIEADANTLAQEIAIFDDLGRQVFRRNSDGGTIRVSDLRSGCYIARLGTEVIKFVVLQ